MGFRPYIASQIFRVGPAFVQHKSGITVACIVRSRSRTRASGGGAPFCGYACTARAMARCVSTGGAMQLLIPWLRLCQP